MQIVLVSPCSNVPLYVVDDCDNQYDGFRFKYTGYCYEYYECHGGIALYQVCPFGHSFDGRTCSPDTRCYPQPSSISGEFTGIGGGCSNIVTMTTVVMKVVEEEEEEDDDDDDDDDDDSVMVVTKLV